MVAGFGNDGVSGFEGCRAGRVYGTYLHGPLLPRNPWFADRLLADALAHRSGGEVELAPLDDELEREAFGCRRRGRASAAVGVGSGRRSPAAETVGQKIPSRESRARNEVNDGATRTLAGVAAPAACRREVDGDPLSPVEESLFSARR